MGTQETPTRRRIKSQVVMENDRHASKSAEMWFVVLLWCAIAAGQMTELEAREAKMEASLSMGAWFLTLCLGAFLLLYKFSRRQ